MHLTWVTQAPLQHLILKDPLIDRVLTTSQEDLLTLSSLEFDVAYVVDKSLAAVGVLKKTHADFVFGFTADPRTGAICPATSAANELWQLGLSNKKKFFENQKTENQLIHEALELGEYHREEYRMILTENEKRQVQSRNQLWQMNKAQPVIGFNTGCGPLMPAKKWTVEFHRQVISEFLQMGYQNIVLLGGPEDASRNQEIGHELPVLQSETSQGLRDGLISIDSCDIIFTGDSLGMHLGIAMKKFIAAWFGPSCPQEIELYDRGVKILADVDCRPCWKRHCEKNQMCYDQVRISDLKSALHQGVSWWQKQVAPNPFQEMDLS